MEDFLGAGSWLPILAGFLPLITGLLLKSSASDQLKAVVNIIVTGVYALAAQVALENNVLSLDTAKAWGMTLVISIATYYGVWKPAGAGNISPESGIG